MDWQKLDASLALVMSEQRDSPVFVFIRFNLPLDEQAVEILNKAGLPQTTALLKEIITATVSRQAIEDLSDQPFVRNMSLAKKLRLLG